MKFPSKHFWLELCFHCITLIALFFIFSAFFWLSEHVMWHYPVEELSLFIFDMETGTNDIIAYNLAAAIIQWVVWFAADLTYNFRHRFSLFPSLDSACQVLWSLTAHMTIRASERTEVESGIQISVFQGDNRVVIFIQDARCSRGLEEPSPSWLVPLLIRIEHTALFSLRTQQGINTHLPLRLELADWSPHLKSIVRYFLPNDQLLVRVMKWLLIVEVECKLSWDSISSVVYALFKCLLETDQLLFELSLLEG